MKGDDRGQGGMGVQGVAVAEPMTQGIRNYLGFCLIYESKVGTLESYRASSFVILYSNRSPEANMAIYMYIYLYICIYIPFKGANIYIYIYVYTHIYIYAHTHRSIGLLG